MTKEFLCPDHNSPLKRLPVMYGMPIPGEKYDDVILGGCCVSDDSPKFGYQCPTDRVVFYLRNGVLEKEDCD